MGSGTDIAMESADMVLMKPNLMDVVKALKISQATITTIKENLFWAFIYNILSIPAAMGVLHLFGGPLLDPMIAGFAMVLALFRSFLILCVSSAAKFKCRLLTTPAA